MIDAVELSCPRCGATLNAPPEVSQTGWKQLPGRKDMAKLQFGDSFCQIEGLYVPVADVKLAPSDSIYFTHHVLLWKDPQVNMTTMSLSGGWKRMLAGLPLVMMQAQGPGHIAFSRDAPGEMIALPLQAGETIDVREHLFMLATGNVGYNWFATNIWYTTQAGDDTETHYPLGMFMDRFSAQNPGLLLLHAGGNVLVRELGRRPIAAGEAHRADLQRSDRFDGLALRASPDGIQLVGLLGESLRLAAIMGAGARRGAIVVRAVGRRECQHNELLAGDAASMVGGAHSAGRARLRK